MATSRKKKLAMRLKMVNAFEFGHADQSKPTSSKVPQNFQ